jgi:hypothetical protein
MRIHSSLLVVAALLATACGAAINSKPDRLNEAIFYFNEGVRWGRTQDVLGRLAPEGAEAYFDTHRGIGKEILMSGYDVLGVTFTQDDNDKADVAVSYTWYRSDQMVVHTTAVIQHWEYRKTEWLMLAEEIREGPAFR